MSINCIVIASIDQLVMEHLQCPLPLVHFHAEALNIWLEERREGGKKRGEKRREKRREKRKEKKRWLTFHPLFIICKEN